MRTIPYVIFDDHERRLLEHRGLPNIGLAFPDVTDDPDRRPREQRLLNHMIEGNATSRDHLVNAIHAGVRARDRAVVESEPEWWHASFFAEVGAGSGSGNGLPLVANPRRFAHDMAENRRAQRDALDECLDLLHEAIALLPHEPDEDAP